MQQDPPSQTKTEAKTDSLYAGLGADGTDVCHSKNTLVAASPKRMLLFSLHVKWNIRITKVLLFIGILR